MLHGRLALPHLTSPYKGEETDGSSFCQRMREHLQFPHAQPGFFRSAQLPHAFNNTTRRDLRHKRDADDGAPSGFHTGSADNVIDRHNGPPRPLLKELDRRITVDAHDQHVPQCPCRLEIPDMPDVKQVEAAVRKYHALALCSLPSQERNEFLDGNDVRTQNQQDRSFG